MRSTTLATLAIALLALAPIAAAQLPSATPSYTLVLQDVPGAFPELTANGSVTVPFEVVLTLTNVVCGNAVQVPVTLTTTVAGAPSGFTAVADPGVINITISQGPHGSGTAGPPGGGSGDGVVRASLVGNITTNASVAVTLVANAPAPPSGPMGCQGSGAISAATSEPATVFANMTAPPPPPAPTPVDEDTPGFTLALALGAIGIALLTRRNRA